MTKRSTSWSGRLTGATSSPTGGMASPRSRHGRRSARGGADQREQRADDREADLDELHRRLDARAVELGLPALTSAERERTAGRYARAAIERNEAREELQRRSVDRDRAAAARAEAAARREAVAPTTRLAVAFAEIAAPVSGRRFDDVLTRIVFVAVSAVQGCDMASVTVRDSVGHRTVASTHAVATRERSRSVRDRRRSVPGRGRRLHRVHAGVPRPALAGARRPSDPSGVESAVSYRLAPASRRPAGSLAGSLNAYAGTPDAFDAEAQEIGLILAAHATLAAGSILEREPSRT